MPEKNEQEYPTYWLALIRKSVRFSPEIESLKTTNPSEYSRRANEESNKICSQIVKNLTSVGLTKDQLGAVRLCVGIGAADKLSDMICDTIEDGQNCIIYGDSGGGKTTMLKAISSEQGYHVEDLSLSIRAPEDFSGIPTLITTKWSSQKAKINAAIKIRKQHSAALLQQKLADLGEPDLDENSKKYKRLKAECDEEVENQEISPEEISEQVKLDDDLGYDYLQKTAACPWVARIMDSWLYDRKKTILFFDEVNQGRGESINAIFQLVQTRRFGDEKIYDLSDCIQSVVAAGNYAKDNNFLNKMQAAAMDRFITIIYYSPDIADAWKYLKTTYMEYAEDCPALAEFLSDSRVSPAQLKKFGLTNRSVEYVLDKMRKMELSVRKAGNWQAANRRAKNNISYLIADPDALPTGLLDAFKDFLTDLGCPEYEAENAIKDETTLKKIQAATQLLKNVWANMCKPVGSGYKGSKWSVSQIPGASSKVDVDKVYYPTDEGLKEFWEAIKAVIPNISRDALDAPRNAQGETLLDAFKRVGITDLPDV